MSAKIDADDVFVLGGDTGAGTGTTGKPYLGGPQGGFFGPQPDERFRLELRDGAGGRLLLDEFTSLSVKRRHTALSDFSVTVPMPADETVNLRNWLLTDARLTFGTTVLFRGRLDTIDGKLFEPTAKLSGQGIAVSLLRGDFTESFQNIPYWEAIRRVWRQLTDFSVTVLSPDNPSAPGNAEVNPTNSYSGTPMSILQSLHDDAGMRFTVLHAQPGKNVISYPAGSIRRNHTDRWDVLGGSREASAEGYANRVTVTGALKRDGSGEHVFAVAKNEYEIATMRERGLGDEGVFTFPIRDESIGGSPEDRDEDVPLAEYYGRAKSEASTVAESKLADLVQKDTVGGQLDIWPALAPPGFEYYTAPFYGGGRVYGEGVYGSGTYGTGGSFATLESATYSAGRGDRSCGLNFTRTDGLAETIRQTNQGGQ